MGQDEERREVVYRYVQAVADRDHDGVWIDAAIALLDAARLREVNPGALWTELEARQHGRARR